jgi:hypothetical protein
MLFTLVPFNNHGFLAFPVITVSVCDYQTPISAAKYCSLMNAMSLLEPGQPSHGGIELHLPVPKLHEDSIIFFATGTILKFLFMGSKYASMSWSLL